MDLLTKTSKAAKGGEVYDLSHFQLAWGDERRRRLMGNELLYPPSPKVIEAVIKILPKANYYPEDASTDELAARRNSASTWGSPGRRSGSPWATVRLRSSTCSSVRSSMKGMKS